MVTKEEFRYRLIYESLSRFSSNLSRTSTFEDLRSCLQRDIKYLFDYPLIRFTFYKSDQVISYAISSTRCELDRIHMEDLWPLEKRLIKTEVPMVMDVLSEVKQNLPGYEESFKDRIVSVWGWNFNFGKQQGVLVSVFTESGKPFRYTDLPVLKITVENFFAKNLNISLFSEIFKQKKELEEALQLLKEKSDEIGLLVNSQEKIIVERTSELLHKNTKLVELSRMNAHTIREPLSRIQGLTSMLYMLTVEEIQNEIVPSLLESSTDLDTAVHLVIGLIENEIGAV